jgi:molybdate transport system ATP-binding protein
MPASPVPSNTSTGSSPAIDARIIKRYAAGLDSEAFELNIHLQTSAGITVLLGPSGSGKTLTLNCLAGFTKPDEGRILVQDQLYFDAATKVHLAPQLRRCGYIFQDHALFPHMTVRQNLQFAAGSAATIGRGKVQRHRRVQELLEGFELNDLAGRFPHELSGGQKQRGAIARALAGDPRLLLFDEPTRGLDYRLRLAFYEILRKAKAQFEARIVLVTHDLDECFDLADSVHLVERGQFLQSGSPEQVFARPASSEIARSLGIFNLLPAEIASLDPGRNTSRVRVLEGEVEGPYFPGHLIGDRGWLCVRHHELRIMAAPERPTRNHLRLRVVSTAKSARGVRILFPEELSVELSEAEYAEWRGSRELCVFVPKTAVTFLAK